MLNNVGSHPPRNFIDKRYTIGYRYFILFIIGIFYLVDIFPPALPPYPFPISWELVLRKKIIALSWSRPCPCRSRSRSLT